MKLSPAVLAVISNVSALTQDEMDAFGCRTNQPHVQFSNGQATGATEMNRYATEDDLEGCHERQNLPCYRTDNQCEMSMTEVESEIDGQMKIEIIANNIPDHYAWGATPGGTIEEAANEFRFAKAPVLRDNGEYTLAPMGAIGFAKNGVAFFSPYNSSCDDVAWVELSSLDYCFGHPAGSTYHYHVMSMGNGAMANNNMCPMSCNGAETSGILGVAIDGFPMYGPMQYFSESEQRIYLSKDACDAVADCQLRQLYQEHLDVCGGQEVADGDVSLGTNYRYIVTNHFPYLIQCFRGDLSLTEKNGGVGPTGGPGGSGGPPTGGPPTGGPGGSGGPPTGGPGGSGGPPTGGPPGRRRRNPAWGRWSTYGANGGCEVNNGDVFDMAYTTSSGCTTGDCGEFSGLYFSCAGCDNDDCTSASGATTTAGPTTGDTTTSDPGTGGSTTTGPGTGSTPTGSPPTGSPPTGGPPTGGPTDEPTTTEEPFDPATDCGFVEGTGKKELVQWKGKNNGKIIAYSADSAIIRFNYFNTAASYDLENEDYIGFLGISKKICGMDFLNQINAGNVTMTFNDLGAFYNLKSQYLRVDKQHSNMMVQIHRKKVQGESELGNSKKDQVWIAMAGLENIDWGNKDWKVCLESIQAGTMAIPAEGADMDWTPCVSWDIDLGYSG